MMHLLEQHIEKNGHKVSKRKLVLSLDLQAMILLRIWTFRKICVLCCIRCGVQRSTVEEETHM